MPVFFFRSLPVLFGLFGLISSAVASEQTPPALPHYMPLPVNLLMVAHAQESLSSGINYRFGGTNPYTGLDGSAFVGYVYQRATGEHLPRTAAAIREVSQEIPRDQMTPGDLVLFREGKNRVIRHIGIYVGDQQFIHASEKYDEIRLAKLNSSYWKPRFLGACRVIAQKVSAGSAHVGRK